MKDFLLLCSLMDPRFKALPFAPDEKPRILDAAAKYATLIATSTSVDEIGGTRVP